MKNCLIAQSGGPTVAINASIAGIISKNNKTKSFDKIYGALHGIEGVLKKDFISFSEERLTKDFIEKLKITPAMYLGSCRYKLPTENAEELYEQIFKTLEYYEIDTFFYIGGNDSMDTVSKLSSYAKEHEKDIKIIGLPKTIDNDLVLTDHTPGFGSAAKFVSTSMMEIIYDSSIYPLKSITIVEIMGRDSGFLTGASVLSKTNGCMGPDLIYLPEVPFDTNECIENVRTLLKKKDSIIIAVSEGIKDKHGNYLSAEGSTVDEFGHIQLMGVGKILENKLKSEIGVKVRSIELNVLQRSAAHIASKTDIDESFTLGEKGVTASKNGETGIMLCLSRKSDSPYKVEIKANDVKDIANKVKEMDKAFISSDFPYVTDEFVQYTRPLILGETKISYANGLPEYAEIKHLL